MIRHMVLMKFTDPLDATEAKAKLEALPAVIPEIVSLEVGLDAVGGPAAHHLALITTHDDLAGLQAYRTHPDHADLLDWAMPRLAGHAFVDAEF